MSHEQDKRMIRKQAEHISRLNEETRAQRAKITNLEDRLRTYEQAGKFYLRLQDEILGNPLVQTEWDRFLAFLRLAMDKPEDLGG